MKSGQITSVHRAMKQKQRYHIEINDEYAFTVHEDILVSTTSLKEPKWMKTFIMKY